MEYLILNKNGDFWFLTEVTYNYSLCLCLTLWLAVSCWVIRFWCQEQTGVSVVRIWFYGLVKFVWLYWFTYIYTKYISTSLVISGFPWLPCKQSRIYSQACANVHETSLFIIVNVWFFNVIIITTRISPLPTLFFLYPHQL